MKDKSERTLRLQTVLDCANIVAQVVASTKEERDFKARVMYKLGTMTGDEIRDHAWADFISGTLEGKGGAG